MSDSREYEFLDLEDKEDFNIDKILSRLLDNWKWFAISIIVFVGSAFLYLHYASPKYHVNASIMVNDNKNGSGGSLGLGGDANSSLSDFGSLLDVKSSVDNELFIIQTTDLMKKVVEDMHLNISYYSINKFKQTELYQNLPFLVDLSGRDSLLTSSFEFDVTFLSDGRIEVSEKDTSERVIHTRFGQKFNTGAGGLTLLPTPYPIDRGLSYKFVVRPVNSAVMSYLGNLSAEIPNKQVSIIKMQFSSSLPSKGVDVLKTLIYEYIKTNKEEKNAFADSTIDFINSRLNLVNGELDAAEKGLAGFKQKNNIADLSEQSKAVIDNVSQYQQQRSLLSAQIDVVETMLQYIMDSRNRMRTVPSLLANADPAFLSLLEKYNLLVSQRQKYASTNTEANIGMISLGQQIEEAKKDLIGNLHNMHRALVINRNELSAQDAKANGFIHEAPVKEQQFVGLSRNREIKQTLYLYLLQRREEMSITKASNLSNIRILETPSAENGPYYPKRSFVLFVGLALGMVIPYSGILLSELLNRRVRREKDIKDNCHIPVMGRIMHSDKTSSIDFKKESRSMRAEQFRTLRANVQFTLGIESEESNVILFTSSMSGEGKSYISLNLAQAMASLGKKVVLVDLDLRKPTLAQRSGILNNKKRKGISNYIVMRDLSLEDIITPSGLPTLDFILSGPIPPNPTELLLHQRNKDLIQQLKEKYDIVILDTAPYGLVSDALLLSSLSSTILYIVREGFTNKKQLQLVDELKEKSKKEGVYIIYNDVKDKMSDRYGYSYGGYAYGYGYGYETKDGKCSWLKGFWKKLKRK